MSAPARLAAVMLIALATTTHIDSPAQETDTVITSARAQARVDFKVNLTGIDRTLHGNDSALVNVLARIDSMVLDPRMCVERITVVGTASPEGSYANNVRLAKERAGALTALLKSRYAFPDSIYSISTVPEDWEGMRLILTAEPTIPYGDVVLRFMDETECTAPDERERRLKRLDAGRPYSSMRDNVLPRLRRASVVVDCDILARRVHLPASDFAAPLALEPLPLTDIQPYRTDLLNAVYSSRPTARRRFFAVKTNLLWDAALCANLGFEVELWPHWSLDVPVWYSPYDITSRWRIRLLAVQPEVRWWPGDAGEGHFVGIHATVAGFNISTGGDYRYQDPNHAAFGVGLGYGYALHLDKAHRWGLEAQVGAGYVSYRWVKYHNTGRNGAEMSRSGGTYRGLTRAGVTLSYKFYRERKERRWMRW